MTHFLDSLFGSAGFLPHGYCFNWSPGLLWSMVVADLSIAFAYLSIPLAVLIFIRKRGEAQLRYLGWMFSAFILACSTTHLMDVWTLWHPDYALQALSKTVTAAVSVATAIALWPLMPRALAVPSVARLQSVIASLEAEGRRRNSAEEQLGDMQQNLAATLASIGAGFIATDREGRITQMNDVAEHLTGWTLAEALGRSLWEVFHREGRPVSFLDRNPLDVLLDEHLTVRQVHRFVVVARGGQRTETEVQAAITRTDDGAVRGMALVLRDMSSAVKAEALAARLAAIVESSSDAIISKTLDGRITTWNSAAETMFGYSAQAAIGQPIQILIPPERQQEEMTILANLARGQHVAAFDTVRRTRSGNLLDVSITVSPIRDGQGRVVGASKIARDISRQRRDEAALRASEMRLRFTLDAAHIGDWEIDLTSGELQHSLRHDLCFGFTKPQTDWSFDKLLRCLHPDDRAEAERSFKLAVSNGSDWRIDCRVVWPDTSVHWVNLQGAVQRDPATAAPVRMLGIVSDITEQREAEGARIKAQRLEAENRQIQEANRLKSQFLANMSHELRTPLNAVIGFSDLLHSGHIKPESPQHREFLGLIGTSGRHLLQLINDVLDLSKVESGKFEFFPERIELDVLLKEVGDILHTAIQQKQIVLGVEIDASLGEIRLDPARLKQALYNYLSNAIKFSHTGGRVTVRAVPEGDAHFRLEVEDHGIGIAQADLGRLFTEFQQLDAGHAKQHQGTGLGLALTRRLVQAQGGSVGVSSTLGAGSRFWIVLNRLHGGDAPTDAAVLSPPVPFDRVLVIENDTKLQARIAAAFADAGFDVDTASDGRQALRRTRGTLYTALTLDLGLPDQRGLNLLANIRGQGASHAAQVIGLTVPADGERATFAITNLLSKPIRQEEVQQAMTRLQEASRGRVNVLVVDDDPAALELMRTTLESVGADVVCERDGRQALHRMDELRPDAIVLDLMMPGFDGFQVLDALQRLPRWRETPVFVWTSLLLTDEEYATLTRSAQSILIKGGGAMEEMLDSVRRWRQPLTPADRRRT